MKGMNTKGFMALLLLLSISTSCVELSYIEPQSFGGEPLDEFPSQMRGQWVSGNEGVRIDESAFYFISIALDSATNQMDTTFERNAVGDSMKLFRIQNKVILNFRKDNSYWEFAIFELNKKGFIRAYVCRDFNQVVKDKNIYLIEAHYTLNDKDTIVQTLMPSFEESGHFNGAVFSGQFKSKSIRKLTRKKYLELILKNNGTFGYVDKNENQRR